MEIGVTSLIQSGLQALRLNRVSGTRGVAMSGQRLTMFCCAKQLNYSAIHNHGSPAHQYLAFPGVRGKGIASRTLERPVT